MSPSQQSPQQLAAREGSSRELINERLVLNRRERDLLNVILSWSLARGREWAVFSSIDNLGKLCGLSRPHASAAVLQLEDKKLLQKVSRHREVKLRFLPTGGELVEPAVKVNLPELAGLIAEQERLNALPEGFEPGGQKLLELQTLDEKHADEIAQMSRDRGEEMLQRAAESPYRIGTEEPLRTETVRSPAYRIGTVGDAATAARAGTRARHEHEHVPTSVPQNMSHEHVPSAAEAEDGSLRALSIEELSGRLDSEGQYWHEQLPAIFPGITPSYVKTWLMRFCDRWRNEAFEAIGETKRKLVAGERFTKGPGQCANYLFKRYQRQKGATP